MGCCQGYYYKDSVSGDNKIYACAFSAYSADAEDFIIDGPKGQISKSYLLTADKFYSIDKPKEIIYLAEDPNAKVDPKVAKTDPNDKTDPVTTDEDKQK